MLLHRVSGDAKRRSAVAGTLLGTTIEAHAGDFLFGPRDIPHRYAVGEAACRMLFICTPGRFEDLVVEMSEPANSRTLPPPNGEEPDMARVAAIAEAHGAELLS
jgi:hypothetical protein